MDTDVVVVDVEVEGIRRSRNGSGSLFLNVLALNTDALQLKGMQAVIAASAAALERTFNFTAKPKVLKQNNTGSKESTAISAFSEAKFKLWLSDIRKLRVPQEARGEVHCRHNRLGAQPEAFVAPQSLYHRLRCAHATLGSFLSPFNTAEELKPKGERALLLSSIISILSGLCFRTFKHIFPVIPLAELSRLFI
ncbi:hypothetical protein F4604DRAFT_1917975 [Suillus subluteus]|nr:hypothetical protein F4604DRAFT_1917975 [Suillus subluteus]